MTTILALDTSTEACSVALLHRNEVVQDHRLIPRRHADMALGMVDGLLSTAGVGFADLDAIAVGVGPGSFTGIRIAVAMAQGLAWSHDLPVIPVSGLQALAWLARDRHSCDFVLACLDARIDELYWSLVDVRETRPVNAMAETLGKAEQMAIDEQLTGVVVAAGNGLLYRERMPQALTRRFTVSESTLLPEAKAIASLAEMAWQAGMSVTAEALSPVYLRDKVARKPGEPL